MNESSVGNLSNTAFFENVTWLNQANWQNFFGKSLPNGVLVDGSLKLAGTGYELTGTMDITENESNIIVGVGAVMANGLYAENAYPILIPKVTQSEATKFICVRFDLENANAKIISKTNVVQSGMTVYSTIDALNVSESYLCTRNPTVYEIPLAFEAYGLGIIDLRRLVYAPSGQKHYLTLDSVLSENAIRCGVLRGLNYAQLYGGTSYFVTITSVDSANDFSIIPMFVNSTEPIIVNVLNNSGSIKNLLLKSSVNGFAVNYQWLGSWESGVSGTFTQLAVNSSMILVIFPVKITTSSATLAVLTKGTAEGGAVDPDSVYTKQEINAMLAQKANAGDIDAELALKENTTNLRSLAYQDRVNYLTQVDNRPTLGTLADHNTVDYGTEVTNKPNFGSLAYKNNVNYGTEVTNKPNFGTLALKSDVNLYVDIYNGSDTSGDGSIDRPYRTISKAVNSCVNGIYITIYITNGIYEDDPVTISGKNLKLMANEANIKTFSTSENYKTYNIVKLGNKYYRFKRDHHGTWADADADEITVNTTKIILKHLNDLDYTLDIIINSSVTLSGYWEIRSRNAIRVSNNSNLLVTGSNTSLRIDCSTLFNYYSTNINVVYNSSFTIDVENFNIYLNEYVNSPSFDAIILNANSRAYISKININDDHQAYQADFYISNNSLLNYRTFNKNNQEATPVVITSHGGIANWGALADKDTVDYVTEVTNKPTFGALASRDTVDYTEVTQNDSLPTYYVNLASGSDSNNSGSSSSPFATIQHAIDMLGVFGGKVQVVGGGTSSAFSVSRKKVEISISTNSTVTINSYQSIKVTNNACVILSGSGTWDIHSISSGFSNTHIIEVYDNSTLIVTPNLIIHDNNTSSETMVYISKLCKVAFEDITLYTQHDSTNGIEVRQGSNCCIDALHINGTFSVSHPAILSKGSVLTYGTTDSTSYFKKESGGLILTGSDN